MKRFLAFLILTVFSAGAVFAQMDLQPVAIVNLTRSEPITVRHLKAELEKAAWTNLVRTLRRIPTPEEIARVIQSATREERLQILNSMIDQILFLQAASRDGINITDNELNQEIQRQRAQMNQTMGRALTDDEFAQVIKMQTGLDYPVYREQLRRSAISQRYLMAKKQAQIEAVTAPVEAEILNFYNISKRDFVRPDTIRFTMIQIPYGADAAAKASAKVLADRLKAEIGSDPSKFDEAVVRSQAPNSGYQAGDVGYLPRTQEAAQMVGQNFIAIAFELRQGQVSDVLEGVSSYQIIKITETLPQKTLELDDIVEPGSSQTVRSYIGNVLYIERQQEAISRAAAELVAELRAGNPFQIMENNLNF